MIKVAMLGFGGIAQSHKNAHLKFEAQGREKLVAICDITPSQFKRRIKINIETGEETLGGNFHVYYDLEEMLKNEEIDLIDICIPSYLHAENAAKLLERGYHVQSEKPMALNPADCAKMLDAHYHSGKQLMIGQCLRFYGPYVWIKEAIEDGRYGKVTSALFQRTSGLPRWGWENWFCDFNRAGGVITDMQIHDLDMARFLFGEPKYVECHANSKFVKYDVAHIALGYDFPVTSIGDWTTDGSKFAYMARIGFENATVFLDNGKITVYPTTGTPIEPEYPHAAGIEAEIDFYLDVLETGKENLVNPPSSAAKTIDLVAAALKSADADGARVAFEG